MWNYRIIKTEIKGQPDEYGLFEVIYNDDKQISAHTEKAEIVAESPEEIIKSLSIMLSDATKCKKSNDILTLGEIEFAPLCNEEDLSEAMTFEEFEAEIKAIDVRDLMNDTIQDQGLNNPTE